MNLKPYQIMNKALIDHVAKALFRRFKIMADERGMEFTSKNPTTGDRQLAVDAIEAVNLYKHSNHHYMEAIDPKNVSWKTTEQCHEEIPPKPNEIVIIKHLEGCNSIMDNAHREIHEKYPKMFNESTQNPEIIPKEKICEDCGKMTFLRKFPGTGNQWYIHVCNKPSQNPVGLTCSKCGVTIYSVGACDCLDTVKAND